MADELVGKYTVEIYRQDIKVDILLDNGINARMLERSHHLLARELARRRSEMRIKSRTAEDFQPKLSEAEEVSASMNRVSENA